MTTWPELSANTDRLPPSPETVVRGITHGYTVQWRGAHGETWVTVQGHDTPDEAREAAERSARAMGWNGNAPDRAPATWRERLRIWLRRKW